MINTDKIRKYTTEHEDYAINWFNEHGFTGEVVHQWVTETAFQIQKDGVVDSFRLTATQMDPRKCNIKEYMKQFEKSFNMKCEIERLKQQLTMKNNNV